MFSGDSAGTVGGGLYSFGGTPTLTDCTISGNTSQNGGGLGTSDGFMTITDSTIAANSATGLGGGLFFGRYAYVSVHASTITGNSASTSGGGIYLDSSGSCSTTRLWLATRLAATRISAGTAVARSPAPTMSSAPDNSNTFYDGEPDDIVLNAGESPLLGSLGYYGGPTETVPLLPGSPAIKAGTGLSGITTDQRGLRSTPPVPTSARFNQSPGGEHDGRRQRFAAGRSKPAQAVNLANVLDDTESVTFDAGVFATAQTITLDGNELVLGDTGGIESITGPSAGVTISGGGLSRIFRNRRRRNGQPTRTDDRRRIDGR